MSLGDYAAERLWRLRKLTGHHGADDIRLFRELMGPVAGRPLTRPPAWKSDVTDDHTPVEFSLAFRRDHSPQLRALIEPLPDRPDLPSNFEAARQAIEDVAHTLGYSLETFEQVTDLFSTSLPQGRFALWCGLVMHPSRPPDLKVYFNPQVQGRHRAPELVRKALDRLGLHQAAESLIRPAEPQEDLLYFSIDVGQWENPRTKIYSAHRRLPAQEIIPPEQREPLAAFCDRVCGPGPYARRPLLLCRSFSAAGTRHTMHAPIRDYVPDDAVARERTHDVMRRLGLDRETFDHALGAVADRPLTSDSGLLSYLSLALDEDTPRLTTYVTIEAYSADRTPEAMPWSHTGSRS
ncbi:tryptophan dimethylallyltransferase family protein [Nonomuraea solani]|nr:tryptophan dimethylallyltransferase family protein [Nonomuraea solani]